MIKAYTDLKQSEDLMKYLPISSADMYYEFDWDLDFNTRYKSIPIVIEKSNHFELYSQDIPCWSLAALINLLPNEFTTENKFGIFKYTIRIRKYKLTEDIDVHQIAYGNYKYYKDGSSSWKDMINTGEKEELLDAVFDMICWLHEQKLI